MADEVLKTTAAGDGGEFRVEVVEAAEAALPATAMTVVDQVARDMSEALVAATGAGLRHMRREPTLYRLVPSDATRRGLADGTLRWADPTNGDASILIKDVAGGTVVGHGELQRVKPGPGSLIGPAAWQAMALATQQHYLAEINEKLAGIDA